MINLMGPATMELFTSLLGDQSTARDKFAY